MYISVDIEIVEETNSSGWAHIAIPLDSSSELYARFRASPAEKEIMAKSVITTLMEWVPDEDREDFCKGLQRSCNQLNKE